MYIVQLNKSTPEQNASVENSTSTTVSLAALSAIGISVCRQPSIVRHK